MELEATFSHYRNLGRVLMESGKHSEAQPMRASTAPRWYWRQPKKHARR